MRERSRRFSALFKKHVKLFIFKSNLTPSLCLEFTSLNFNLSYSLRVRVSLFDRCQCP
jgi:hypothetical protein